MKFYLFTDFFKFSWPLVLLFFLVEAITIKKIFSLTWKDTIITSLFMNFFTLPATFLYVVCFFIFPFMKMTRNGIFSLKQIGNKTISFFPLFLKIYIDSLIFIKMHPGCDRKKVHKWLGLIILIVGFFWQIFLFINYQDILLGFKNQLVAMGVMFFIKIISRTIMPILILCFFVEWFVIKKNYSLSWKDSFWIVLEMNLTSLSAVYLLMPLLIFQPFNLLDPSSVKTLFLTEILLFILVIKPIIETAIFVHKYSNFKKSRIFMYIFLCNFVSALAFILYFGWKSNWFKLEKRY